MRFYGQKHWFICTIFKGENALLSVAALFLIETNLQKRCKERFWSLLIAIFKVCCSLSEISLQEKCDDKEIAVTI